MSKLVNSIVFKFITAGIIFVTLLFPIIQQFIEIFFSKPTAESLWTWSLYTLLLMLSCIGLIICLVQAKQISTIDKTKTAKIAKPTVNNNKEELKKKLSETEAALRSVIANLTKVITDLSKEMEEQDSSLAVHKENITKAKTIQDYVKIGDILVSEISSIIESNRAVRTKLKNAEEIIDEQNKNLAELVTETMTDHLTTVLNKRGFDKRLDEEYLRYKRYGGDLSMISLDIDHFKEVNDTYGHLFGDKTLRSFAQLVKNNIRGMDIIARVGGEEFNILLPETDLEGAAGTAQKIHGILSGSVMKIEGKKIKLTASIGVAVLKEGEPILEFVDRADEALYLSKKAGRNKITTEESLG